MSDIQLKDPSTYPDWANANPIAAALMEIAIQLGRLANAQQLAADVALEQFRHTTMDSEEEAEGFGSLSDH
jgi:hypothetical protein